MKKWIAVLLMLSLSAGFAQATLPLLTKGGDDIVTLDVNLRPRYEVDGRDFNADTGLHDYGTLRTMVGINLMPDKNLLVRVRMKEARRLGTQQSNQPADTELHAQEAYLQIADLWGTGIELQAGRFEFWYGRKRLHGTGGWNVNGPRTYDGARVGFMGAWDLIWVKVEDYDFTGVNIAGDNNLFVLAGSLDKGSIQPIFTAQFDNSAVGQEEGDSRYTAGLYYGRTMGAIRLDLDGYYQLGKRADRDQAAWLLSAETKFMVDGPRKPFVGFGADVTSGNKFDEDGADDDDNVFYAPFMSRHIYRGYMDYFRDVRRGLMDLYLTTGIQPRKGLKLTLDVHNFTYMQDEQRLEFLPGGVETIDYTALGQEIDLRVIAMLHPMVTLDGGYSIFMPSDDFVPDGDMSHFVYCALVAKF